jgi:hypothetical protein
MTIKTTASLRRDLEVALEKEAASLRRRSNFDLARDVLLAILLLAAIGGAISLASYGMELISMH